MKKTIILCLVVLILLLQGGLVSATQIHKDWHVYNDIFTVNKVAYEIVAKPGNTDVILFKTEGFSAILGHEGCVDNNEYRYCYENYSFDYEKEATLTDVSGILMPGIQVSIDKDSEDTSSVSVGQTYPSSILIGKEGTFVVKLNNKGDLDINSLRYELEVPEGLEITELGDFTQVGNKIYFITKLKMDVDKEFEFEFKSTEVGNQVFERNYEYDDGKSVKKNSASHKVIVKSPIEFSAKLSPSTTDILEYVTLTATVKNNDETVPVEIERLLIKGPSTVGYTPLDNLAQARANEFSGTDDTVDADSENTFELRISPKRTGKENFTGFLTAVSGGKTYEENFSVSLTVKAEGIDAEFYTNKKEVLSGGETTLIYALGNKHDELDFKDLEVKITSDFFSDSFAVESVPARTDKDTIYNTKINVPHIQTDEKYDMIAVTTFKTESGQEKSFENKITFSVTGSGEILKLSQKITKPGILNPGDEITVKVDIENLKDDSFQSVRLFEEFSRGGKVTFGDSFITLALTPQEKQQAYLYKLKLPDKYFHDTFNVTSTVSISDIGYTNSKTSSLKVNATPEEEMVEGGQVDSKKDKKDSGLSGAEIYAKTNEDDEEPNFMVKMIRAIENFFSGLFG